MGAYRQAAPQILSTVEVDQSKSLLTQRQQSLIKSRTLFLLLLQIKALDWKATVGVGCNPLIASLDAFYARWKCTTGAAAIRRVPAWCVVQYTGAPVPGVGCSALVHWCLVRGAVHPYLPHHGQFEASLALEGTAPPISMTHCMQLHH